MVKTSHWSKKYQFVRDLSKRYYSCDDNTRKCYLLIDEFDSGERKSFMQLKREVSDNLGHGPI